MVSGGESGGEQTEDSDTDWIMTVKGNPAEMTWSEGPTSTTSPPSYDSLGYSTPVNSVNNKVSYCCCCWCWLSVVVGCRLLLLIVVGDVVVVILVVVRCCCCCCCCSSSFFQKPMSQKYTRNIKNKVFIALTKVGFVKNDTFIIAFI